MTYYIVEVNQNFLFFEFDFDGVTIFQGVKLSVIPLRHSFEVYHVILLDNYRESCQFR